LTAAQSPTIVGREAEQAACEFLQAQGLKLLERNFRVRGGEIDLVMSDGAVVVFVEVRARQHGDFMHPAESITVRKRHRLINAGTRYLQRTGGLHTTRSRFDVVCIFGTGTERKLEWIKRAFEA
jgi:putative endonuclease